MSINIQPTLENEQILISPLQEKDFENLYLVASDPKIWEQHPNKDRCKREVFKTFFDGAILSKGAFKVIDKTTGNIIGSTRFYDYNQHDNSILIGYTFYATACWGKGFNNVVKTMLLDYIFEFVTKVTFHIGANNVRSLIAIERLGVTKTGEQEVAYFGEESKLNCVFEITKQEWFLKKTVIK